MGRELKRVPLDFDWPLDTIWPGYMFNLCAEMEYVAKDQGLEEMCKLCRHFCHIAGIEIDSKINCGSAKIDPPSGEGYQLWTTTTEGAPISPVFRTLRELAEWVAENATTFASFKATADEWEKMLAENNVHHQEGNAVFL